MLKNDYDEKTTCKVFSFLKVKITPLIFQNCKMAK